MLSVKSLSLSRKSEERKAGEVDATGLIPWQKVNVIFISKPGKLQTNQLTIILAEMSIETG